MTQRVARAFIGFAFATATGVAGASVFYKLNVVAETGVSPAPGITKLGNGPSINGKGKVAYVGIAAAQTDESIYVWSPVGGNTDVSPGLHPQNRTFGEGARINDNDEVAVWTHTYPSLSAIYEIRVLRGAGPIDNGTVAVRGIPGGPPYDGFYAFPWINNNKALEDRSSFIGTGNKDGVCDSGETCFSQTAFNAYLIGSPTQRYIGTAVQNPFNASDAGTQHQFGLNTTTSRPVISEDGRVLVRGNAPTNPIILFDNYALSSQTTIANTAAGFTWLGQAPGMTPDGKIVAFAGDRGHGQGIFLSIETAPGVRRLVRIVGENATVPKAELGVDLSNNKLYFQSIDVDSRVGVIYTPDYLGVANKSVVVSFVGTPNAASRMNPGTGKPFGFSNQKGLWTIRIDLAAPLYKNMCVVNAPGVTANNFSAKGDDFIDTSNPVHFVSAGPNGICESENGHDTELLFSRSSPIPVVQVGDLLHSAATHVVSDIAVHDPISQANFTAQQVARTARNGDHRIVFWAAVDAGAKQMIVQGEHLDSDQDGLLDHWETTGIDLDGDGGVDLDLPSMGADPLKRDLFIQLDWTADRAAPSPAAATAGVGYKHRPIAGIMRKLVSFYGSAPALPNGIQAGITLHVDAGPTAKDVTGQFFTRNMGSGATVGGQTYPGAPVDILYQGPPNSVSIANVNAVSFDTAKSALFWSHNRGAREFAFMHVVFTDFHHAQRANGNDDNVNPFKGNFASSSDPFTWVTNASASGSSTASVIITGGPGAGQIRRVSMSTDGTTGNKILNINAAFNPAPTAASTFVLADPSTGLGQAVFRYDGAFAPGRNLTVTLGDAGRGPQGELADADTQFQSFDHEMGHLLSLMHGGVDHDNYKSNYLSVMNYAYQFCPAGQSGQAAGPPPPAPCPIEGYSGASDPISNNWNNVSTRFALQMQTLGNAFGAIETPQTPFPPPAELPLPVITAPYGPLDTQAPTTTIAQPAGGATFSTGATIPVTFSATDNIAVTRGEVLFDVNGDGTIADNEVFVPTFTPPGSFSFTIPATSGPSGSRRLSAIAYDARNNPGIATVIVNVGTVPNIVVPNVVNTPRDTAADALDAANFGVGAITFQTSPSIPPGNVISENPAAGQVRAPGTPVALVVSLGPNGIAVPNVIGLSQSAATNAINAAGLSVGGVKTQSSNDLPGVTAQSPGGGDVASAGAPVYLLVSIGPGVTVPNVVGLTQAAAQSAITGAGLVVGTVTSAPSDTVPSGSVISQNPLAGASVASGSAVNLVVSSGVPPPTQRTAVSPAGVDTNFCTFASPCRSFNRAISRTLAGGEVIVLASAGYGSMVIDKAISISASAGVYAGISVTTGTGIVVNPASGRVTLRGLTITGLGGARGIDLQTGDALYVDDCTVSGFTQAGLYAQPAAASSVWLRNSAFRDNTIGVSAGLATAGSLKLGIEGAKLERNGTGVSIVAFGATGTIRTSVFSDNGTGLAVVPAGSGASARLEIRKATFKGNGTAIASGGVAGTTSTVNLAASLISGSTVAGLHTDAGGTTYVADTTITRNANALQQSAGGASVTFGNNRLLDNTPDGTFTSSASLQ